MHKSTLLLAAVAASAGLTFNQANAQAPEVKPGLRPGVEIKPHGTPESKVDGKTEGPTFAGLLSVVNKNPNDAAQLDHVRILSTDQELSDHADIDSVNKFIVSTCATTSNFFNNSKHGKPFGLGVTCSILPTGHTLYELEVRPVERQDNKMAVKLTDILEHLKAPPVTAPIKLQILMKVWYPKPSTAAFFKKGFELQKAVKYKEAVDQYSQAIAMDPNATEAYTLRAICYNSIGQYDKAITDLTKAIELGSRDAYIARAFAYRRLKQPDNAMADCNREIELNPKYWEGYVSRAELWQDRGNHDEAIKDCNTVLQFMSTCGYAYLVRGASNLGLKHPEDAIRDLSMAVEILPKSGEAYHYRAEAYKAMGKQEEAASDDTRASALGFKKQ